MSIKLMTKVWEDANVDGNKLLLLLALADMASDEGYCWPSYKTLAKKVRLSRTHTMTLMQELVNMGYVRKEERYVKAGEKDKAEQTSNGYWIKIPEKEIGSQPQLTTQSTPVDYPQSTPLDSNHQSYPSLNPASNSKNEFDELQMQSPQNSVSIASSSAITKTYKQVKKLEALIDNQVNHAKGDLYAMAQALADVTGMAFKLNRGRLTKAAKVLLQDPQLSPTLIRDLYSPGGAWYSHNWMGQKGEKPLPEHIAQTVGNLMQQREPQVKNITGDVRDRRTR